MKKRTIILWIAVALALFGTIDVYLGIAMYYQSHFMEHTTINGLDVSDLTAQEAEQLLASVVEDYQLIVTTREGTQESISGASIDYQYLPQNEMEELLKRQNVVTWLPAYVQEGNAWKVEAAVTYDTDKLKSQIKKLACMQSENITAPQDAYVTRQDGQYVVVAEVEGNQPDEEKVEAALSEAVSQGQTAVDLQEEACYEAPSVREDDTQLCSEAEICNRYTSFTVTYTMGGDVTVELGPETIADWFSLDEDLQPVFDRDQVEAWVNNLADTTDTIGTWPEFTTSNGEEVWLEAITYGWQIDRESEAEELYQVLLAGESVTRTPVYYETARTRGVNDIGDTYVEIDYTNQRLWYYKDGVLLVETPVVTGNVSQGTQSPEGIFCIVNKEQNAILKGEGYETPVTYWMPFYGGVGIHDADSWRSVYGGTIYQTNGSHGCINTPTEQAALIYANIEIGTPVICYSASVYYGYDLYGYESLSESEETTAEQSSQDIAGDSSIQDESAISVTTSDSTVIVVDENDGISQESWGTENTWDGSTVYPDTTGQ